MKSSKYFSERELTCRCGCGDGEMDEGLLEKLDDLRERVGIPLFLTSAKRCESHNRQVGGSPMSAHVGFRGKAVDIQCFDGKLRDRLIDVGKIVGFRRRGIAKSFVHFDVGEPPVYPQDVTWTY